MKFFQDRHGDSNAFPPKDVHDDYELTGAIKNGSRTVLTFRRKLNTCDKEDMEITVVFACFLKIDNTILTFRTAT